MAYIVGSRCLGGGLCPTLGAVFLLGRLWRDLGPGVERHRALVGGSNEFWRRRRLAAHHRHANHLPLARALLFCTATATDIFSMVREMTLQRSKRGRQKLAKVKVCGGGRAQKEVAFSKRSAAGWRRRWGTL